MEAIQNAAFVSIGRACGFAGLADFVLMIGLSFDPALAARIGGLVSLGVTLAVLCYGLRAPSRSYKKTEAWLILKKEFRPPASVAQQIMGNTLRDTSFWFVRKGVFVSSVLLAMSVVLKFV